MIYSCEWGVLCFFEIFSPYLDLKKALTIKNICTLIILLLCYAGLSGQLQQSRIQVDKYNVNSDELPANLFRDISTTSDGYIAFWNQGFWKFDGSNYFPIDNYGINIDGLFDYRDYKDVSLFIFSDKIIVYGKNSGTRDTIVLTRDEQQPTKGKIKIFQTNDDYIIFSTGKNYFIKLDRSSGAISHLPTDEFRIKKDNYLYKDSQSFLFLDDDNKIVFQYDFEANLLHKYVLDDKVVFSIDIGSKVIIATRKEMTIWEKGHRIVSLPYPIESKVLRGAWLVWGKKAMVILNDRFFVFDTERLTWEYEFTNMKGEPIMENDFVSSYTFDDYGNLYLALNYGGLVRLNLQNLLFTFYGDLSKKTFAKCTMVDERRGSVFLGTTYLGVREYDLNGNFLRVLPIGEENILLNAMTKLSKNHYLICDAMDCKVIEMRGRKIKIIKTFESQLNKAYFTNVYETNDREVVLYGSGKYLSIKRQSPYEHRYLSIDTIMNTAVSSVKNGNWMCLWDQTEPLVHVVNMESGKEFFLKNFKTKYVKSCIFYQDSLLLMGTSNGIFQCNLTTQKIEKWGLIEDWDQ